MSDSKQKHFPTSTPNQTPGSRQETNPKDTDLQTATLLRRLQAAVSPDKGASWSPLGRSNDGALPPVALHPARINSGDYRETVAVHAEQVCTQSKARSSCVARSVDPKQFFVPAPGRRWSGCPEPNSPSQAPAPSATFAVYQRRDGDEYSELDDGELRTAEATSSSHRPVKRLGLPLHLSASTWHTDHVEAGWKVTWTSWYKIRWELTWHDLPPAERASYGLYQPIWFHSDAMLHYEQRPWTITRTAHRRCIGMVVKLQRIFRLHVSRVFGVRSLADFMRDGGVRPSQQTFVQRHNDFTMESVLSGRQAQWLRVQYKEAIQIVKRIGASHLVLQPESRGRHPLPYLGCSSGDTVCLVPLIPRSALLRVVWTPQLPTKQHPMTIHSQGFDEERIQAYVKYNKHLQLILLPVFADLQFRLAFRLWQSGPDSGSLRRPTHAERGNGAAQVRPKNICSSTARSQSSSGNMPTD